MNIQNFKGWNRVKVLYKSDYGKTTPVAHFYMIRPKVKRLRKDDAIQNPLMSSLSDPVSQNERRLCKREVT